MALYRPKFDILWFEKGYDAERKLVNFFAKGVRVVRASVAENRSLTDEGDCKCGRFRVELPSRKNEKYNAVEFNL
jgi:hypothetical protein